MASNQRLRQFLAAALLWLLGVGCASAQWLVYELRFTPVPEESVNFSFYTGAYLVAPVQGGAATVILTTEEDGRFYAVSEGAGKYFVAANQHTRRAVFSASALTGSSQALYTASGILNRSLLLDSPAGGPPRSWRVAEKISGRLMAADDEAGLDPAPDGSLGMVGSALITGTLREDLTANATQVFSNLAGATSYLLDLLEKYGYQPDTAGLPPPPPPGPLQPAPPQIQPKAGESAIDPSLFPLETQGAAPAND